MVYVCVCVCLALNFMMDGIAGSKVRRIAINVSKGFFDVSIYFLLCFMFGFMSILFCYFVILGNFLFPCQERV